MTLADRTNPLDYVEGNGNIRYHVPDTATLDRHITALTRRIHDAAEHAPITVQRLRADRDRLLDRRLWLQETT